MLETKYSATLNITLYSREKILKYYCILINFSGKSNQSLSLCSTAFVFSFGFFISVEIIMKCINDDNAQISCQRYMPHNRHII